MSKAMSRRTAIRKIAGTSAAAVAAAKLSPHLRAAEAAGTPKLKGRINHSVCQWCYKNIPLEDLCRAAKEIGLPSIELLKVEDFPTLKKFDLTCAVVTGVPGMIANGLNRLENH